MNHLPSAEPPAHRLLLAMDRSVRSYDLDGHLRVSDAVLTAEGISSYRGREVPNGRQLGLAADQVYRLYRPGTELAKAAPSLRGKPLLLRHVQVSSSDHPHNDTVGSVGSDVRFDGSAVRGSLVIWTDTAQAGLETGKIRDLSASYRYTAIMKPGQFRGEQYDGIMTGIEFNHLAIVEDGRVPGAMVGDAALKRRIAMDDDPFRPLNDFHREKLQSPADVSRADELVAQLADALTSTGQADDLRPRRGVPGAATAMDGRLRQRVVEARIRTNSATQAALERKFPGATKLRRSW